VSNPLHLSENLHTELQPVGISGTDVVHSLLAPAALVQKVLPNFDVGAVLSCALLAHNQDDLYQLTTERQRYVIRVYRAISGESLATLPALLYELELLLHLSAQGIATAAPVARRDGRFISAIAAPEGTRHVVLFTHARGDSLSALTQTVITSEIYGRAVGAMHRAADRFASAHVRPALDLAHLIERPLDAARPLLAHRPDDWAELCRIAGRLTGRINALSARGLDWGVCHGDLTGGNAHLTENGELTLYDFEYCGPGWRAYDLAVFRWALALSRERLNWDESHVHRLWSAFLQGYRTERQLHDADVEAVPAFVLARQFWYLGLRATNRVHWGAAEVDDRFFDWLLSFLREWEALE